MAGADKSAETRRPARELFRQGYRAQLRGRMEDAIRLYHESIQAHPTAEAYTFLGWTHSARKDFTRAIALCRQAIDLDADYGNPYNDIGAYLIEQGHWDEAEPWLQAATRARRYGSYHLPHYNLGRLFERRFDFERARRHFRTAVRLEPRYKPARQALLRLEYRRN
ncbi:MAG: tetratricopeptide repeat protein [Candidatus Eisenbacteria bacterium]